METTAQTARPVLAMGVFYQFFFTRATKEVLKMSSWTIIAVCVFAVLAVSRICDTVEKVLLHKNGKEDK